MPITMHMESLNGASCIVHRLPPGGAEEAKRGYGMRIVGYGRGGRAKPWQPRSRYFEFFSISHLFEGKGFYWTPKDGISHFEAGSAVIVTPGFVHSYGGDKSFYVEDSVCFCGPVADSLQEAGIIKPGVVAFGMERRLLSIIEKAMDPSASAQISANVELQRLLLSLNVENKVSAPGGSAKGKVAALIEDLKLNPERWWTVEELAESCNLGEVQFRRVFHELAGMPPKRYVEMLKMRRAMEMLAGSGDSVAEIGKKLSYSDPFHFSRRFKEATGMSPADYKKSMAALS